MNSVVDLPQPDGPSSATNSPSSIASVQSGDHLDIAEALDDVAELDPRHPQPFTPPIDICIR